MLPGIIFAQVWGVIQFLILTSLARTVRVRTVFAAMAVGFYLIGPIAAFIQLSWIHLAAPLFGMPPAELQSVASYSVDPFLEEALKLAPLALLMLIPAIRRQWSVSDCVLMAAATGSGYGLTEHLFRYAGSPHAGEAVSGGWIISIGSAGVFVPGFFHSITSWIPSGASFSLDPIFINWHLAWSAIGGLAVGILVRRRDKAAIATAVGLLLLIGLIHAEGNLFSIRDSWLEPVVAPLAFLQSWSGLLAFAAIVAAWWLDQPSHRARMASGPLLAGEEPATSHTIPTFTLALSRLPWSIPWVYGFDRERRAVQAVRATSAEAHDDMLAVLVARRDSVDRKLEQSGTPKLLPSWLEPETLRVEIRSALRRPPVIIWLVLIAPSILFLIVGGFPATAGIQSALSSKFVWPLFMLITVASQARNALRVFKGIRELPATARLPVGDDAAMLGLKLASGVGAVALGGFTLARVLSGVGASERLLAHAHAADAAGRATPAGTAATANSATAGDPPAPAPNAPQGSSSGDSGQSGDGGSSSGDGAGNSAASPPVTPVNDLPNAPPADTPGYSPLPPPVIPVNDLPDAPPAPYEYQPLPPPVVPVNDLPDAPPAPYEYQPLPPPVVPVNDLPDAPPAPYEYQPLPPPTIPVNDLPDAPPVSVNDLPDAPPEIPVNDLPDAPPVSVNDLPNAPPDVSVNDLPDAPPVPVNDVPDAPAPAPAPAPHNPSPQDAADQAADKAAQAQADADAAQQAKRDAQNADESSWIKSKTGDSSSDPDVAAAQARTRAAHDAEDAASQKASEPEDPWDPTKNKDAADAAKQASKDAEQAQQAAQDAFDRQQAADAAAAHDAAKQAESASDAASAQAAAAKDAAAQAQANANAAAAKAASDAARAANPAQAAADDAARELAAAQKRENDAFMGKDAKAYHDARAALDAARANSDAAKAAAEAAKNDSGSPTDPPHRKN